MIYDELIETTLGHFQAKRYGETLIPVNGSDNCFLPLEVWFDSDYTMRPDLMNFQMECGKFR